MTFYTNSPQTAARISWAYPQGGRMGRLPPDFGQGDAYTNAPPQLVGTIFALYGTFSPIS